MHPDNPRRVLNGRGDIGDAILRSIRREDGVRMRQAIQLPENFLLNLDVFEKRPPQPDSHH